MADEPNVTEEIPEDIGNMSLTDDPAPQEDKPSEPEETPKDKGSDTPDKPKEETEAKGTEAKEESSDDPQVDEQKPEETSKEDPKEIARRAYQERQRTKAQVAQQLDQVYGPKTQDQLIEEGIPEAQAQVEALRQEMLFDKQRAGIAEMNAGLQSDAVNVLNDFPVFNPNSKDYDPDFSNQVQEAYKTAARLQTDENGIVLNAEVGLYDFHKQMHDIYSRGNSKGSQQGQADALQMLSRTETPGSSSSKPTGDSLEEMEERLGGVRIA